MSRTAVVLSAVFAAALGAAAVVLVLPDTGPDIVESQGETKRPKKKRQAKKAELQARLDEVQRAKGVEKDPKRRREALRKRIESSPKARQRLEQIRDLRSVDGEQRAEKREELRSDRFARTEERLKDIGDRLDWDEPTTAEVIDVMRQSHDDVTAIMEAVDRGEKTWDDARPEMRDAREAQADAIRDVLGDDGYDEFTGAMGARSLRAGPVRARGEGLRHAPRLSPGGPAGPAGGVRPTPGGPL